MRTRRPVFLLSALATLVGGPSHALAANPGPSQQASFGGASNAFFGYSVAIDGDTAVVGAMNDDGGAGGTGAAYVYVRTGQTWMLQQKLVAPNGISGDEFGYAVAVSGNAAMIGAAGKASGEGSVYAFTRSALTWAFQQELTETSGAANDCFGCSLALSGSTALVGADGVLNSTGAAYVFVSAGSSWSQQGLGFIGHSQGDYFGYSVSLSPAGDTAVVGAFGSAGGAGGAVGGAGSAYVFVRGGTTWGQPQPPLTASDGMASDNFGYAVAAGSGSILIGAYTAGGPGAAYAFTQSAGTWSQTQKLVPPDPTGGDWFGLSVALSGNTAVVGARQHTSPLAQGAAYVFTGNGATWSPVPVEIPAPSGAQYFGSSVAVSATTEAIAAFGASNYSGAAYLFAGASPPAPPVPALGKGPGLPILIALLGALGSLLIRARRGGLPS